MSPRTLKQLAAALAGLVVIWLGLRVVRVFGRDREGKLVLRPFDPKAADQALIIRGADTLRFARHAGGWTVNGYRANSTMVGNLVRAIADTGAPSALVSEHPASQAALGLDTAHARRVSALRDDSTLGQLLVGLRATGYAAVYVRRPDDSASYQMTQQQLAELSDRRLDDWRDKVIAKVPTDSVTSIEVRRGRERYSLTRGDGGWRLGTHGADSAAVAALLEHFGDIEAAGFPTPAQADSVRFSPPDRMVQLLALGGRPLLVLRMDSTAGGFWARREGDSTIYRLENWTASQMTPADSTLLKKAAPTAPARRR
jgi:hypothetical protein